MVLTAYEYQCAFCGYDGMIGTAPVGLEAAHVRWWALAGPDDIDNGLCLCSLHHKLFDKGVLGIGDGHRILVSQRFIGRSKTAREHVTALAGRPLIGPQPGIPLIAAAHRSWPAGWAGPLLVEADDLRKMLGGAAIGTVDSGVRYPALTRSALDPPGRAVEGGDLLGAVEAGWRGRRTACGNGCGRGWRASMHCRSRDERPSRHTGIPPLH